MPNLRTKFLTLPFDLADTFQCPVPAQLQLRRHQRIGGVGRVVLPEGAIGGVAHRFHVADQSVADLIATRRFPRISLDRCGDGTWLDNFQDRRFNGIVRPQPAKGDAARLAIVEPAPMALLHQVIQLF
jgi:hypothetical protein